MRRECRLNKASGKNYRDFSRGVLTNRISTFAACNANRLSIRASNGPSEISAASPVCFPAERIALLVPFLPLGRTKIEMKI